ncbi:Uncharacterised protein [Mycobacteroides abscessus subsp. abscessus]|nr:Uncharacterised protein [Mycobacteroides abscessus subsp. abscessus]
MTSTGGPAEVTCGARARTASATASASTRAGPASVASAACPSATTSGSMRHSMTSTMPLAAMSAQAADRELGSVCWTGTMIAGRPGSRCAGVGKRPEEAAERNGSGFTPPP